MSLSPRAPVAAPLLPRAHAAPPPHAHAPRMPRPGPAALLALALLSLGVLAAPPARRAVNTVLPRLRPGAGRLREGYAIVAACHNRHDTLRRAAASWLITKSASQIVVIDWASDPPLRPVLASVLAARNASTAAPTLTVVRVADEPRWVLTRAYNLAIRHAEYDHVFKVDCDYITAQDAIVAHPLRTLNHTFFTGYYMNARDENEIHLNGALVVSQRRFWQVGGYDERIQAYGFDDTDLYNRLTAIGMTRRNVSYDSIAHISHEDWARAQRDVKFPRVHIDVNRLLLEKINDTWGRNHRSSEYQRVPGTRDVVKAIFVPTPVNRLVKQDTWDHVWKLALGSRLRDDYNVPWGMIASMNVPAAEKLLGNLNRRKKASQVDEVVHEGLAVRLLFLHVQHGLGNRLRVLASGLSFASRTGREPVVIWERDVHFRGLFSDIFNTSHAPFAVLDTFEPKWPLRPYEEHDSAWGDIVYYNYLLPEGVGKPVVDEEKKNIYFKSSAIMNSALTSWESENEELRKLRIHGYVTAMASRVTRGGFENVGGVHIRNRSLENDIVGVKDNRRLYGPKDAAEIEKWRETTKYTSFVSEMHGLLKNRTVDKFFVATDTFLLLAKIESIFPEGKILFIKRDCDDRSGRCEQFAMADLLVLARTKVLLGSTWSSFTEAAMRLGGPKALMAGKLSTEGHSCRSAREDQISDHLSSCPALSMIMQARISDPVRRKTDDTGRLVNSYCKTFEALSVFCNVGQGEQNAINASVHRELEN